MSVMIIACDPPKAFDTYSEEFRHVMKTETGFLRGLSPGMPLAQVKEIEKWPLKDEEPNYLFYEQYDTLGRMNTLEINFENGLKELRLDSYFISAAEARSFFNELKEFYTARFGESEDYYGFSGWNFEIDERVFNIELNDESAEYRQGKISLFVYEHIPETPKKPK